MAACFLLVALSGVPISTSFIATRGQTLISSRIRAPLMGYTPLVSIMEKKSKRSSLHCPFQSNTDDGISSWDSAALNELQLECVSGSQNSIQVGSSMDPELLSEFLMETGALSVVIEDADKGTESEQPIFNQPSGDGESWYRVGTCAVGDNFWRRCSVKAYYSAGIDISEVVDSVVHTFGLPAVPRYTVNSVPDQDWIKVVQQVQIKFVVKLNLKLIRTCGRIGLQLLLAAYCFVFRGTAKRMC